MPTLPDISNPEEIDSLPECSRSMVLSGDAAKPRASRLSLVPPASLLTNPLNSLIVPQTLQPPPKPLTHLTTPGSPTCPIAVLLQAFKALTQQEIQGPQPPFPQPPSHCVLTIFLLRPPIPPSALKAIVNAALVQAIFHSFWQYWVHIGLPARGFVSSNQAREPKDYQPPNAVS